MTCKTQTFRKDPDATLDYGFDWSDWLAAGETIADSDWDIPAEIINEDEETGTDATKVWLSGGTAGTSYTITNTITTSAGRIDERSMLIIVEER